jgi:hypothetical protein
MPKVIPPKTLKWEVEACAFTVAIVLARMHPTNSFSKFDSGIMHRFTAKDLVDYCSELNWSSELDLQVGLVELMQGIHIFNSGKKHVLEDYFHLKLDDSWENPTPVFGELSATSRSWKITFLPNFKFSRPADINSKKKLLKVIKDLHNDLLKKSGYEPSSLNSLSEVWELATYQEFRQNKFTSPDLGVEEAPPLVETPAKRKSYDQLGSKQKNNRSNDLLNSLLQTYTIEEIPSLLLNTHRLCINELERLHDDDDNDRFENSRKRKLDYGIDSAEKYRIIEPSTSSENNYSETVRDYDIEDAGIHKKTPDVINADSVKKLYSKLSKRRIFYSIRHKQEALDMFDAMRLVIVSEDCYSSLSEDEVRTLAINYAVTKLKSIPLFSAMNARLLRKWVKRRGNTNRKKRGVIVDSEFEDEVWAQMILVKFEVRFIII